MSEVKESCLQVLLRAFGKSRQGVVTSRSEYAIIGDLKRKRVCLRCRRWRPFDGKESCEVDLIDQLFDPLTCIILRRESKPAMALTPKGPLIVTLVLDHATHAFLTDLRQKYFPSELNKLKAHITLFHAIPPHRYDDLDGLLRDISSRNKAWDVFVGEPRLMGKSGVMLSVRDRPSGSTEAIHAELLGALSQHVHHDKDRLTDQDMRRMDRPHVTVLNKAPDQQTVDRCLDDLERIFNDMKKDGQRVGQKAGKSAGLELCVRAACLRGIHADLIHPSQLGISPRRFMATSTDI